MKKIRELRAQRKVEAAKTAATEASRRELDVDGDGKNDFEEVADVIAPVSVAGAGCTGKQRTHPEQQAPPTAGADEPEDFPAIPEDDGEI